MTPVIRSVTIRPRVRRLFGAAAVVVIFLCPIPAHAQFGIGGVVFDPKNLAQAVLIYKRAYDQLVALRTQLQNQATALQKLKNPNWREIGALVTQVDALARQGTAIAYSLASVDAEFQRTFPDTTAYGSYRTQQSMTVTQLNRTLATMRGVLDAASQTARTFSDGITQLRTIKQQMASITGHEQALELANTVTTYSAEELTLLRQQIAALTNAQTVYYAHELTTRAQQAANERAIWAAWSAAPAPASTISFRPDAP